MPSETILVVDDNIAVRALIKFFLESAGYNTLTAGDAENAITLYKEKHQTGIVLLLTDVEMPDRSGLDLADDLLRLQPKLPVLLMSGHENPNRGFGYLGKPFTRAQLIHGIDCALASRHSSTLPTMV
jgi:CheY-like chemotaxis protein